MDLFIFFLVCLVFFGGGGNISYLKDKGTVMEQPNSSLRRMAAGSLWKDRLTLPPVPFFSFFLLFAPKPLSLSPPLISTLFPPRVPSSLFCRLSLTKCRLPVMISNPTKWLQQKRELSHATMHPHNNTQSIFIVLP